MCSHAKFTTDFKVQKESESRNFLWEDLVPLYNSCWHWPPSHKFGPNANYLWLGYFLYGSTEREQNHVVLWKEIDAESSFTLCYLLQKGSVHNFFTLLKHLNPLLQSTSRVLNDMITFSVSNWKSPDPLINQRKLILVLHYSESCKYRKDIFILILMIFSV